ncbi:MAG: peptidoglycan endopeptidase [Calditrichaeota bacterium]|nr:MAG: peptidoglycan endopeptidase [Calditrichota bacterium]MBL1206574.1 peptidoglycan endopeptidase [Calditrichota bacterium]NOG46401.1 C40 family peptidase [Calditrichota bacterium]
MEIVYVNVDSANLYREANYRSAIDSQVVLWEKLERIEKEKQFSYVHCEDGYKGWVSNHQICKHDMPIETMKTVTKNHSYIFEKANVLSQVIREVCAGSSIPLEQIKNDMVKTFLPDGKEGWVRQDSLNEINGDNRSNLIMLSKRFLGVPYFWGGKSAKGLDCSGYVQLLHKLVGISIRRDSPMQFEDAVLVSENPLDGQVGDLLFFAEEGNRITHVAVKLSDSEIIHARGMVRINSLIPGGKDFDKSLLDDFVAVKTFLNEK